MDEYTTDLFIPRQDSPELPAHHDHVFDEQTPSTPPRPQQRQQQQQQQQSQHDDQNASDTSPLSGRKGFRGRVAGAALTKKHSIQDRLVEKFAPLPAAFSLRKTSGLTLPPKALATGHARLGRYQRRR